ncbi:uncharacterized protein G2W53_022018 [Senna tora]|uniref:Uncharacterized protein n=1 Tax=Senna tora TaxID=362788 RepID=A0A834TTS8_9FABA|nr:uncharacterized protein G2W53_022018 [Senna tora]
MTESRSRRHADPVLAGTPWQRPRAIASDNPKPGAMAPFGAGFWLLDPKFEVSTCQIQP